MHREVEAVLPLQHVEVVEHLGLPRPVAFVAPHAVATEVLQKKNATGNWQNRLVTYDQMMTEWNESYESMLEP